MRKQNVLHMQKTKAHNRKADRTIPLRSQIKKTACLKLCSATEQRPD